MQVARNHGGTLLCGLLHYVGYITKALHGHLIISSHFVSPCTRVVCPLSDEPLVCLSYISFSRLGSALRSHSRRLSPRFNIACNLSFNRFSDNLRRTKSCTMLSSSSPPASNPRES